MNRINYLHIFATSRAIRAKKEGYKRENSFLPKMATVGDFESRAVTFGDLALIDNMQRAIYLKEASNFEDFNHLQKNLNLIKFYTNAKDFFRFFEEVTAEGVEIKDLYLADSYAEFDRDLNLLEQVLRRYKELLKKDNLNDKIFIPKEYKLNRSFIESFDGFVLELDGYLSNFELKLFEDISKIKPFIIKLRVTQYNQKIVNSFKDLGIDLPSDSIVEFDLSKKEILSTQKAPLKIEAEVIEVKEHLEQIAVAIAKIEELVNSGIDPSRIALIVPDESIVPAIRKFDRLGNFNFAMGRSFREYKSYKFLEQIDKYLRGDDIAKEFLSHNGFDVKKLQNLGAKIDVEEFFKTLKELELPLFSQEDLEQKLEKLNLRELYFKFNKTFKSNQFSFKDWLFLWLNELKEHSIDDTSGGKVTVMGLLESRGISFDGVVILDFNDGAVPAISNKDRFLNSAVRAHAKLPTKADRENLQKHYYASLLDSAKKAVIIYSSSDNTQPSKFLYELNLANSITRYKSPLNLLFDTKNEYNPTSYLDDVEVAFDASKIKWSAHRLKIFLECKRRYYYRYEQGLKEPPNEELNEGLILHKVLAEVLTPNSEFNSFDELKKAIKIKIDNLEAKDKELIYKKVLWDKILDDFIKKQIEHSKQGWSIKDREFEINGTIGSLKFTGRVDRLDIKEDRYFVLDYKSGSSKKANVKDAEKITDFQMNIYAKLLDKPANKIDFAFVEILNGGDFIYLEGIEEKEEKLLEHIEYLKSQKSYKASRCEELSKCRYCPYQLLCHRGEYL